MSRFSYLAFFFLHVFVIPAFAQFPFLESFSDASASGMSYGGSAYLTAATGPGQIDQPGSGVLRLTSSKNDDYGYAISNVAFPSGNGLSIEFEYFMYQHNGIGADGISFFLFDAANTAFNIGGFGGSLGYAPYKGGPGLSNAYIGIGIDSHGNFSAPIEGRETGPGNNGSTIVIRGPGNGGSSPESYKFITSARTDTLGYSVQTGGRRTPLQNGYRKIIIDLKPNPNTAVGGYIVSVTIHAHAQYRTRIDKVISELPYLVKAPDKLRFGFAASTGYYYNTHEIANFKADLYTPSTELDSKFPSFLDFPQLTTKLSSDQPFIIKASSTNKETPIILTSSNPEILSLKDSSGVWWATILKKGVCTVTATQAGNGVYSPADAVLRTQVINQPIVQIPFSYVTPSDYTPQDFSAWLTDDPAIRVPYLYTQENDQNYHDVAVWLSKRAHLTKIALTRNRDYSAVNPAYIFVKNGIDTVLIGTYTNGYDEVLTIDSIMAEAIIIRKKANVFPLKIKAFGLEQELDTLVTRNYVATINFPDLPVRGIQHEVFDLMATSNNADVPITFVSSNPAVLSVFYADGKWKAKALKNGTATITASQKSGDRYLPAVPVQRSQVLKFHTYILDPSITSPKIPLDAKRWYYNNENLNIPGLASIFNGLTEWGIKTDNSRLLKRYEAYYPLRRNEVMEIDAIRLFDNESIEKRDTFKLYIITDTWRRVPIAKFTSSESADWVGADPARPFVFKLDSAIKGARYLLMESSDVFPTEIELFGVHVKGEEPAPAVRKAVRLKDMFGVNAWEWNFYDTRNYRPDTAAIKPMRAFSGARHFTEWSRLEKVKGKYTFGPEEQGFDLDQIFQSGKDENIEITACIKGLAPHIMYSYPTNHAGKYDNENVPAIYGSDLSNPQSYLDHAKLAFQFAARYGTNKSVNPALLTMGAGNTVKTGLGTVKYIECNNETNKSWKGRNGYQTGREYAANLSAFYDGHMNTMGPGAGVKNADPNMKVVMGGIASDFTDYIRGMVDWCKEFRGYKADGTANLCWDVSNYHQYFSDDWKGYFANMYQHNSKGIAPELSPGSRVANEFIQMSSDDVNNIETWITEVGYDARQGPDSLNSWSAIRTFSIGSKNMYEVKADWTLRTALMFAREGIAKNFFYASVDVNGGEMYTSTHLIKDNKRTPAADFLYQTYKKFGEYTFKETLSRDPFVDRYQYNGRSMYAMVVPDQVDRKVKYTLQLDNIDTAYIYRPKVGQDTLLLEKALVTDGQLIILVTETPAYVFPIKKLPVPNAFTWTGTISTEIDSVANWKNSGTGLSTELPNPKSEILIPSGLSRYPVMTCDFAGRNITIETGASVALNGHDLIVNGNLLNKGKIQYNDNPQSTITFGRTDSVQVFTGNTTSGSNQTGRLVLSNPQGLRLAGPFDVHDLVNIQRGSLISNGFLTLKSGPASFASIYTIPTGSTVSGNVNVEVYFSGGSSLYRSDRTISSPINDQMMSENRTFAQLQKHMVITGPGGVTGGFDPGGFSEPYAVSLKRYNEAAKNSQYQYKDVNEITERLLPGRGAFLFYRGDRSGYTPATASTSAKVNAPYAIPESSVVTFTGPINQGDIKVPMDYRYHENEGPQNGYNLVGNPYPCAIHWDKLTKTMMEDYIIKILRPDGGYATFSNGVTSNTGGMEIKVIQPGQGFFVKAHNNPQTAITFTESSKVIGRVGVGRFLSVPQKNDIWAGPSNEVKQATTSDKTINITLRKGKDSEETVIAFKDGRHAVYQGSDGDASYFPGAPVSLSSRTSDGVDMAINFMPPVEEVTKIKLNVDAKSSGKASMEFDFNLDASSRLVLKDDFSKTKHVLKDREVYSFEINKDIARSFGHDRFSLVLVSAYKIEEFLLTEGDPQVVKVYPNPTADIVNVTLMDGTITAAEFLLYDLTGKLVESGKLNIPNSSIDISHLQSGTYIISVKNSTGAIILNSKIIKK